MQITHNKYIAPEGTKMNFVKADTVKKQKKKLIKNKTLRNPTATANMWCVARFSTMCNFKNVKNTHGGMLLLVKLQAEACNFTKSNIPPWVFFTFFCGGTILSN